MKINQLLAGVLLSISSFVLVGSPVVTLTSLTATGFNITNTRTAFVQYVVTNQSITPHTFVMIPIPGVTQILSATACPAAFSLEFQQSCTLSLLVTGSQMTGNILGGPQICQQASSGAPNPFMCYQPRPANTLSIQLVSALSYLYAGGANGYVYYSANNGANWMATSSLELAVNSVFATQNALYAVTTANNTVNFSINNGQTWQTLPSIPQGIAQQLFVIPGNTQTNDVVYVTSTNGLVYYFTNNAWTATAISPAASLTGISVIPGASLATSAIYVGDTAGFVHYSGNNGGSWASYTSSPDGTAIKNVQATRSLIYVNTANEYVYTNTSLIGGATAWTTYAQGVNSLYASPNGTRVDAGTQNGFVFSLAAGVELGFVGNIILNSLYLLA